MVYKNFTLIDTFCSSLSRETDPRGSRIVSVDFNVCKLEKDCQNSVQIFKNAHHQVFFCTLTSSSHATRVFVERYLHENKLLDRLVVFWILYQLGFLELLLELFCRGFRFTRILIIRLVLVQFKFKFVNVCAQVHHICLFSHEVFRSQQ